MDGTVEEIKARKGKEKAKPELDGKTWSLLTSLFADNLVFLMVNEEKLHRW